VSKTVSDKLRAHLLSQGIDGIPASNTAVFNVLQDHGIALATPDGKAIWKATIISDSGWSHSFTFLKLSPAMIWEASDRPTPFAGRVQIELEESTMQTPAPETDRTNSEEPAPAVIEPSIAPAAAGNGVEALLDLLDVAPTPVTATMPIQSSVEAAPTSLPDHAPASMTPPQAPPQERDEPSGPHFMNWLHQSIQTRKLVINDAKALVHTVAGTVYLLSPGVFQRYAQEHPQITALAKQDKLPEWQWVQKRFEKLGLHRKQGNGLNIWTCEVKGPRKSRRVHGYLLDKPETLFHEVPPDNPYLSLPTSSVE
jgi:hypothetical protein